MQQSPRADRDGDVLAVISQSGPTVSFFDAASDRLLGAVEVPAEPHELRFDPTQRLLWCTTAYQSGYYHANSGRRTELTAIDPDTRRVVEVVDLSPNTARTDWRWTRHDAASTSAWKGRRTGPAVWS